MTIVTRVAQIAAYCYSFSAVVLPFRNGDFVGGRIVKLSHGHFFLSSLENFFLANRATTKKTLMV